MKKIKVQIKDKDTLELLEDASKGDFIDLKEISLLDTAFLEQQIQSGKDQVYQKKLETEKEYIQKEMKQEYEMQMRDLKDQMTQMKMNYQNELQKEHSKSQISLKELEQKFTLEKKELEHRIDNARIQSLEKEKNIRLEIEKEYLEKINALKMNVEQLETGRKNREEQIEKDNEILDLAWKQKIEELKSQHKDELRQKENEIEQLKRQKSVLNVKQTGEDLETWCHRTVLEQMQNGFFNCEWYKDNEVVRELDEAKGSKADYIFKIYASEEHLEEELLASVCLDMKDENPDSVNKKTNEHYYKALDNNRKKKQCKYAVLVSNLEMDKPNDIPIYRVREYPDMYVVRPAYLMTFLHMITSLSTRFGYLLLNKNKEELEVKDKLNLLKEFEDLKKTYLEDPLARLEKEINEIEKQNMAIRSASDKIDIAVSNMKMRYLKTIQDKLDRFERKVH